MAYSNTNRSVGVMTRAMQTATISNGPKVLRVGLIQSGKIVEERVVGHAQSVTIGSTEQAFLVVAEATLPAHYELFSFSAGEYSLRFQDNMTGRLATPEGVFSLDQLRMNGQAKRAGNTWVVALNDQFRGKVNVGEVSVLFQFVNPPPVRPRAQLPVSIRSKPISSMDWGYSACLAAFLTIGVGAGSFVEYGYDPEVAEADIFQDPIMARLAMPAMDTTEPTVIPPNPEQTTQPTEQTPSNPTQTANAEHTQRTNNTNHTNNSSPENRMARALERANSAADVAMNALQQDAQFHALLGVGGEHSAQDALANGGNLMDSVDALARVRGVAVASNDRTIFQRTGIRNPGVPSGFTNNRLFPNTHDVPSGTGPVAQERIPHGVTTVSCGNDCGTPSDPTSLSQDAIARVIRQNVGAVRTCYEQGMRVNPGLAGRLEVSFTIGTSGRITNVSTDGLDEGPTVRACVERRFRGFVFPVPSRGAVDADFSFNLQPGQ